MQLYNSIDVTQIEYKWITDGIVIWNYNISDKIYETNKHLIIKSKQIIIKKRSIQYKLVVLNMNEDVNMFKSNKDNYI